MRVPEGVEIVPMRGSGATGVGEHENRGAQREAKGCEAKYEDERVEAPEFLFGHGGVEVMSGRGGQTAVRGRGLAVTERLRRSHGGSVQGRRSLGWGRGRGREMMELR